jgi:hypothetical protein
VDEGDAMTVVNVPDPGVIAALQAEMNNVGFLTGTQAQEDMAWGMAQEDAETFLSTNLLTGTVAEERHIWPQGWLDYDTNFRFLQLKKTHVRSITLVQVVHDLESCNCETDTITGCMLLYRPLAGEVEVRHEGVAFCGGCCCAAQNKPAWVDVTYVAGLWDTLADMPGTVKMALAILAREYKQLMQTAGASAGSGFVNSWRSMDYSETGGLLSKTVIGSSPEANYAARLLRKYQVRRMVAFRGRPAFD